MAGFQTYFQPTFNVLFYSAWKQNSRLKVGLETDYSTAPHRERVGFETHFKRTISRWKTGSKQKANGLETVGKLPNVRKNMMRTRYTRFTNFLETDFEPVKYGYLTYFQPKNFRQGVLAGLVLVLSSWDFSQSGHPIGCQWS